MEFIGHLDSPSPTVCMGGKFRFIVGRSETMGFAPRFSWRAADVIKEMGSGDFMDGPRPSLKHRTACSKYLDFMASVGSAVRMKRTKGNGVIPDLGSIFSMDPAPGISRSVRDRAILEFRGCMGSPRRPFLRPPRPSRTACSGPFCRRPASIGARIPCRTPSPSPAARPCSRARGACSWTPPPGPRAIRDG